MGGAGQRRGRDPGGDLEGRGSPEFGVYGSGVKVEELELAFRV